MNSETFQAQFDALRASHAAALLAQKRQPTTANALRVTALTATARRLYQDKTRAAMARIVQQIDEASPVDFR